MARPPAPSEAEPGLFETRIWLRTLKIHAKIFAALNSELQRSIDLSVARFELLAQLDLFPDGITLGALSRRLQVTNGNISGLVRRLQAEDLIARVMSDTDRRSFIVCLTSKGRVVFSQASAIHRSVLTDVFAGATPPELESILEGLTFLGKKLKIDPQAGIHRDAEHQNGDDRHGN